MFPLKICGAWCLIYTSNHLFMPNSKLQIDYNRVKFSPKEKVWGLDITKNMYGVVRIDGDTNSINTNRAKIVWMKSMDYEVDTHILPVINLPHKGMFCQTHISYKLDDTLTINDGIYDYVFTRDFSDKKNDTLIRAFMTQLILDHVIRHIQL
uniref:Uncharacterized protein n=1 Tax=viral metagenome TaxID=1070528 RepID=A0A6C0D2Z2_9ZZZZ